MIPKNVEAFAKLLTRQRAERRDKRKAAQAAGLVPRRTLSSKQRDQVLAKTKDRCHICGGEIHDGDWQMDHVFAHSGGGEQAVDNCLPAHSLCNNYRWDYSMEEFQEILKLGVWVRTQIIRGTKIGKAVAEPYLSYERKRENRRKSGVRQPRRTAGAIGRAHR